MQLSPEVRAFLEAPNWGVLATTNPDGTIQQTMMWYALIDDSIVMNTAAGRRKHHNMLARPDVSVCVVDGNKFVTVQGKAIVSVDDPALHRVMGRRYMTDADLDNSFASQYDHEVRLTITIPIEHVIPGLTG